MVRLAFLFSVLLLASVCVHAQTATPTPGGGRSGSDSSSLADAKGRLDRLHAIDIVSGNDRPAPLPPQLNPKSGIYRRPGRSETQALAVDPSVAAKYAGFLLMPNTGIIKLNGNSSCVSTTAVVSAADGCSQFGFAGAGTAFSFRTGSYTFPRLADVTLFKDLLVTGGVYQQELIVDLGNVPIESVALGHAGFLYLNSLTTVRDTDEYGKYRTASKDGLDANGFKYRISLPAKLDTTYAVRSIAYRAEYPRVIDGYKYNELDFDKRRDVTVVFRAVDRDAEGNITILWKVLKDAESPKLKQKNSPRSDQ